MIPCSDNVTAFTPTYHYDFTRIADIANKPEHATVDIIGVATAVGPLTEVTSKKGTQLVKRVLTVSDDSNAAIEVRRATVEATTEISTCSAGIVHAAVTAREARDGSEATRVGSRSERLHCLVQAACHHQGCTARFVPSHAAPQLWPHHVLDV